VGSEGGEGVGVVPVVPLPALPPTGVVAVLPTTDEVGDGGRGVRHGQRLAVARVVAVDSMSTANMAAGTTRGETARAARSAWSSIGAP
jgi:hypothetical protein